MTAVTAVSVVPAAAYRASARRRVLLVIGSLTVAIGLLFWLSLSIGTSLLPIGEVLGGLTGQGKTATVFVIQELRVPRASAAVLIGLALGASGTLFQRVLGNPLASPDFLGVAAGAGTATAAAIVLGGFAGLALPAYALIGGGVSAALIYFFAWRRGVSAYRFILIGIGVAAFAQSTTAYLVARAEFKDARAALTWLIGSVGLTSPPTLALLAAVLLLFVPGGVFAARALRALELGDDSARMLGARAERDRLLVLGMGVALIAVATAAAGPIGFVAMLAGPLSAILLGNAGRSILAAALAGAIIIQIADLLAQHALPWPVSTGVVTGIFGAPYIVWVLISSARKASTA